MLPRSVPLPSLGGQHCGRHRRRSGHGGAAPIPLRFVLVRCPRAWPVRWSCALVRVRPPAATRAGAGSGGCGGARRARPAASPSRASRSFLGEGGRPLGRGGGRGSAPPWPAGRGGVGGRGEGGPRRCSLLLRQGGRPVAPGPVPLPLRGTLPGYTRVTGRSWARARSGRPPVGQCGGGGERFPSYGLPPHLPQVGIKAGRLVCVFPGATMLLRPTAPAQYRRPAAGYVGVSGRPTGGAWRAAAFAAAAASPPGVQRPLRGGAGPPSLWSAPGRPRAGGGGREGGGRAGGGSPLSPPGPLAPPPDGRGGAAWWFRSRGASR